MDWFERLTGFKESRYNETQAKLIFEDRQLICPANGKRYDLGTFELPSLKELRVRTQVVHQELGVKPRRSETPKLKLVHADAYHLHAHESANGAVIQVASQFNLLEMPGMHVTPEDGVTNYQNDKTQGPACAMAAGPATLYRNYGIPLGSERGQTTLRQINTLQELVAELGSEGFEMINGYAICNESFLRRVGVRFLNCDEMERQKLKGLLKVGVHWQTQVTAKGSSANQRVTQVFCSALPIAYNRVQGKDLWEPFARLILEALYEATFCIGVLNAKTTGNPNLYLTQVGGGVFGNDKEWISQAIKIQLRQFRDLSLIPKLAVRTPTNMQIEE